MYLISFVCLFWAAMVVLGLLGNFNDWISLLIPAALTILLAYHHVRLKTLGKRLEALEQKLSDKENQN